MKKNNLVTLCEAAIMIALGIALSYVDIPLGFSGGSINLAMIPILVFALRHGCLYGVIVGLVLGTLKFFFAGGVAINWESMLLDYSLAYGSVGLAGLFKNVGYGEVIGTLAGGFARFLVHFISGITIYAEYADISCYGLATPDMYIYSVIYNGVYMLPSIVIALIAVPFIVRAVNKYSNTSKK